DDIEHWLADEPVSAYRDPWTERLSRWQRRHRSWVRAGLAALAVVIAAAFLVYAAWMEVKVQRGRVVEERKARVPLLMDQGLSLGEQGNVSYGLLWLARGLEIATQVQATDLQRTLRANLADWGRQLRPLKFGLQHNGQVNVAVFSPDGRSVLTGSWDGAA